MTYPTFDHENELWQKGYKYVAGVDEVGRGCFAGPVVAAAVVLPPGFDETDEINDSKLLSAKKREKLAAIIKQHALAYAIGEISVEVINHIGIGRAAQQAFSKALLSLSRVPDFILSDAFLIHGFAPHIQKPIIHGDRLSVSIAAASIIAKVYRDKLMQTLHHRFPVYDFATNKGYGTKKHREVIGTHGLCDLHRTSFNLQRFLPPDNLSRPRQSGAHGHETANVS
ncbi:MAG: ribonuclease HII [Patescibacteria group bacterium]